MDRSRRQRTPLRTARRRLPAVPGRQRRWIASGDEVEAEPLVGHQQGVAKGCAGHAAHAQLHPLGMGGQGPEGNKGVHPWLGEDRVAQPDRVPNLGLVGRPGQTVHLLHGGHPQQDAPIRQISPIAPRRLEPESEAQPGLATKCVPQATVALVKPLVGHPKVQGVAKRLLPSHLCWPCRTHDPASTRRSVWAARAPSPHPCALFANKVTPGFVHGVGPWRILPPPSFFCSRTVQMRDLFRGRSGEDRVAQPDLQSMSKPRPGRPPGPDCSSPIQPIFPSPRSLAREANWNRRHPRSLHTGRSVGSSELL